ncbi:BatA domain-containing protein [Leeuwenhoekiella sp. MAR_2009_132]|uniref:BatA domain-containing protein n=1 Tax=Leeuwenhoekiella sp. MAR_2009_132 TaxID=1392489 RepID=UPI00048ACE01|nr:BatA domain-containing protein [Leeuwenhoekiella sp. MAR_2009_132]
MQFKNPEILYALFLLLIPILIHLFQLRRYKKTPFTNVAFLQNLVQNTRKSSSLKKWLVLATRLTALTCLIFAFAQPYFPVSQKATLAKETVVFIDNSFSMQATGKKGTLLTEATQDLLENLPTNERITIATWDDTFKDFDAQTDRNTLLDINFSPRTSDSQSLLLKLNTLFSTHKNTVKQLVLLSDFQNFNIENTLDTNTIQQYPVVLKPVSIENFSIDSISVSRNAELYNLHVMLSSTAPSDAELPVSLYNDDKLIAKASVKFASKDTASLKFQIPTNKAINGKVSISDAFLKYDNSFYFSINKQEPLKVLAISNNDADFLKRLFRSENFEFTSISEKELDYTLLQDQNMIVLNELTNISGSLVNVLKAHTQKGGIVVLIPAMQNRVDSYTEILAAYGFQAFSEKVEAPNLISQINYDHPLYKNVFTGRSSNLQSHLVESYFKLPSGSPILSLENGDPFLTGSANLYVFTGALAPVNSNFINGQLIVPTFDKMALAALSLPQVYYTIGNNTKFDINAALTTDAALVIEQNGNQFIPLQERQGNKIAISTAEGIFSDGLYAVKYKQDTLAIVAFNHDRAESRLQNLNTQSSADLSYTTDIKTLFNKLEHDSDLNLFYKWFVIFALLAFLAEMLLLKFLK